jgi:hypothetical protein
LRFLIVDDDPDTGSCCATTLDLRLLGQPVAGDDGFELLKGPEPQPYGDLSD